MEGILVQILKVLFILVAAIMTFFILLQEGKGGGLAGLGGTKAAGVEGVTNPIRRATAVLAIIFFLLAVILGMLARPEPQSKRDKLYDAEAPAEDKSPPGVKVQPEAPPSVLKKAEPDKTEGPAEKEAADKKAPEEPAKAEEKPDDKAEKKADKPADKAADKPADKAEKKADEPAEKTDSKKAADKPAEKKAE